jgi:hypothetical protein
MLLWLGKILILTASAPGMKVRHEPAQHPDRRYIVGQKDGIVDSNSHRAMIGGMKSATRTPNVRIIPRAHELPRQLADEERRSMQSVLDRALERYQRDRFLRPR